MKKTIYHGSERIIRKPTLKQGKPQNDFGRGFYCTEEIELAKEWACKKGKDGYANEYTLDLNSLNVCNLNSEEYHILNWLAVLTKYRSYWQKKSIAEQAKIYLQENFTVDLAGYDLVIGYRADDSYFSFAQDFIMGTISLQKLEMAMKLGRLGEQIVLKSEKAFGQLEYVEKHVAFAEEYYVKKAARDLQARRDYHEIKIENSYLDDIYMIDILRGRVREDDIRI